MKYTRLLSLFLVVFLTAVAVLISACSTDSYNSNDYTKYIVVTNERIEQKLNYGTGSKQACYVAHVINRTDKRISVTLNLNEYSKFNGGGYVGSLPAQYEFSPHEAKTVNRFIPNLGVNVEAEWEIRVLE